MLNYDKPSRIFPCILLTRNHMIFLVQFGINKHLLIFFIDYKLHSPYRLVQFFGSLKKIYSSLYIPNCTRNHVITYTNNIRGKITYTKEIKNAPSVLLSSISTREFLRTLEKCGEARAEGEYFSHFSSVLKNSQVLII